MKFLVPLEWQEFGVARSAERTRSGPTPPALRSGTPPLKGRGEIEKSNRKSEIGNRKSEIGNRKSEIGNRKSEIGNRKSEQGITVVELLVVLAIIAVMMGLSGYAMTSLGDGNLKKDAGNVTAAIKYTYSNAAINNSQYRLVFSMGSGTYFSEVSQSAAVETAPSNNTNTEDYLTEEAQRLADKVEKDRDLFKDDEENPFGVSRKVSYERVEDGVLKKTKLSKGVRFSKIVKGNSQEEYTSGEVSMTFFPNGFQEQVMIVLETEAGAKIALVTEPLTGRILTYSGTDEIPEGFGEVEEDD